MKEKKYLHNLDKNIILNFFFFSKSECLKEAFYEIDVSNDIIEIVISKEKELLRFSSFGIIGDTHVIYFLI